jgi:Class II Aldolase and Adducin N-terminal domain
MLLADEWAQLVEFGRRLRGDELTVGTSGNLSIRGGDLVAITPSGVAYESLTPESTCVIDLAGATVDGNLQPSSELPMHTLIHQHTDATVVGHTHPLYASTLSVLVDELPPGALLDRVAGRAGAGGTIRPIRQPATRREQPACLARALRGAPTEPWRNNVRREPCNGVPAQRLPRVAVPPVLPRAAARPTSPAAHRGDQRGRRPAQKLPAAVTPLRAFARHAIGRITVQRAQQGAPTAGTAVVSDAGE